jgi:hypothetical protein
MPDESPNKHTASGARVCRNEAAFGLRQRRDATSPFGGKHPSTISRITESIPVQAYKLPKRIRNRLDMTSSGTLRLGPSRR